MAFRNRSADVSRFSMVPRSDVPRSVFTVEQTHKTTFDAGWLVPIYVDEVLPGDSFKLNATLFARLATPLVPAMDNLHLDTFFFFVPNRLIWVNWTKFMGERATPNASQSYLIPQTTGAAGDFYHGTLADHFGIPCGSQLAGSPSVNALPFRAYNLIWNEWFRDENLQDSITVPNGDGPDDMATYYLLRRRGKRKDYFTSALPWPQKPTSLDVSQGFGFQGGAPVSGLVATDLSSSGAAVGYAVGGGVVSFPDSKFLWDNAAGNQVLMRLDSDGYPDVRVTIAAMREAFQVQRLLERDARGGTRYAEIVRSHFGVVSPDARLQRPEYLGGGHTTITINPVAQTSATAVTGSTTALGTLGGIGTGVAQGHGFSSSFTEHGYIIGLACVRADLTYQEGLERMWSRRTKFDFYWPAFANLGEQAVLAKELFYSATPATDNLVFGYQERFAEYKYKPNRISGYFRSTTPAPLDMWHYAQEFGVHPPLNDWFITDQSDTPLQRVLAVGAGAAGAQILMDGLFSVRMVRPIPAYSVPGLADHF